MTPKNMPAKVLKRIGQLRRLGGRGLVRTTYVRALGPSVYRLTDPARQLLGALHRQTVLKRSLDTRLVRLMDRAPAKVPGRDAGATLFFAADLGRFVQTLEALFDLESAGCPVPKVTAVDWHIRSITIQSVRGKTYEELACYGERAEDVRAGLEQTLTAIHRAGYVLGAFEPNGILFKEDSGMAMVMDLSSAVPLAGVSRDLSIHLRDADRERFNKLFGTRLMTARQLRGLLSPKARIPRDRVRGMTEVYAPVVLRDDIRWGKIWNTDLGVGRWNFIMRDYLPIPIGGSILDLGSNNGFNPLQMLRSGAASAIGIEIDPKAIEQAKFLKAAFEWLDNRSYNFRCIHGSQGDLPHFNLPRFDVVTAFCSLYYLPEAQIRMLLSYIRGRTNTLILQCNTDRLIDRGGEEETFRKASIEFAVEMLEKAGFTDREIIAPAGYSRPLVIGRAG